MSDKDLTQSEIEDLKKKVKGWFENPHQFNSWILFNYLNLSKNNSIGVKKENLKESVKIDFEGNFNSMKSNSGHNHGKIFIEKNDEIKLYEPIAEFILEQYKSKFNNGGK
ncbi:hypothetical protein ACWIWK_03100 [Helicobacter sp. 23-1048]